MLAPAGHGLPCSPCRQTPTWGILAMLGRRADVDREAMIQQAAERLRKRDRLRERLCAARRARAQAWAHHVADVLAAVDPSVRKIVGFGSTFETWRSYRLNSDIDLGVVGGSWARLSAAVPTSEFDVSLVELELQDAEFTDYVIKHGVVLYENE